MDNFVQGKVNIFINKPIPREEAIRIIEINLLLNKYSLVPAGGDLVKVIGTGQNPRTAGVPIISDEDQIPIGDHVISFLFKLRFADPTELNRCSASTSHRRRLTPRSSRCRNRRASRHRELERHPQPREHHQPGRHPAG
jgi:hypothetical protein